MLEIFNVEKAVFSCVKLKQHVTHTVNEYRLGGQIEYSNWSKKWCWGSTTNGAWAYPHFNDDICVHTQCESYFIGCQDKMLWCLSVHGRSCGQLLVWGKSLKGSYSLALGVCPPTRKELDTVGGSEALRVLLCLWVYVCMLTCVYVCV